MGKLSGVFFRPAKNAASYFCVEQIPNNLLPGSIVQAGFWITSIGRLKMISPFFEIKSAEKGASHSKILSLFLDPDGKIFLHSGGEAEQLTESPITEGSYLSVIYSAGRMEVTLNSDPIYANDIPLLPGKYRILWGGGFGKSSLDGYSFSDYEFDIFNPDSPTQVSNQDHRALKDDAVSKILSMSLSDFIGMVAVQAGQTNAIYVGMMEARNAKGQAS